MTKVGSWIVFKQRMKHFINVELCGKCFGTCKGDPVVCVHVNKVSGGMSNGRWGKMASFSCFDPEGGK